MPRSVAKRLLLRRCGATRIQDAKRLSPSRCCGCCADGREKAFSSSSKSDLTTTVATTATATATPVITVLRAFHSSRRIPNTSTTSNPESSSLALPTPSWRDVFPPEAFVSIWEPHYFPPRSNSNSSDSGSSLLQDEDPALDVASKHVIYLLQRFYRDGVTHIPVFVTRDWCHYILEQLALPPPQQQSSSSSRGRRQAPGTISAERVQRANALLSAMHLMDALQARTMPFSLPRPNARTYRLVLEMHARQDQHQQSPSNNYTDDDNLATAVRARDWVLRMQTQYRLYAELSLQASVVEWNLVLQTYAQAPHVDRARRALQVMTQHMLSSSSSSSSSSPEGTTSTTTNVSMVDASSFLFLARACGHAVPNEQAAIVGAHCAAVVWDLLLQNDALKQNVLPTLTSHFYSTLLQSIRHLPRSDLRERVFEQVFDQARAAGKLNTIIVQEFLMNAKPLALVQVLVGAERLAAVQGLKPTQAARQLVETFPSEWTQHRDGN